MDDKFRGQPTAKQLTSKLVLQSCRVSGDEFKRRTADLGRGLSNRRRATNQPTDRPTDKLINFAADGRPSCRPEEQGRLVAMPRECERLSVSTVGERSKSAVPF